MENFPEIQPVMRTSISEPSSLVSTVSSSSNSGCTSTDDIFDVVYMQNNTNKMLKLSPNASLLEVQAAIELCKTYITDSSQCSDERKWYVRYLVELRLRVQQLVDADEDSPPTIISALGHHFEVCSNANAAIKQVCDHCCSAIWSVMQGAYVCKDCNYICHLKCVDLVSRVCAHIIATERRELLMQICPENGLAAQQYKCAECKTDLNFKIRLREPRLCDYFGLYFCSNCHWNNTSEIPARIVHNWDWEKRPVSQAAYQLLTLTRQMPLINLEAINEKIFSFVVELDYVRTVRNNLKLMKKYLVECQAGSTLITPELLCLTESQQLYSLERLEMIKDNILEQKMGQLLEKCREHITLCTVCKGKAYLCELCVNNESIFPFDSSAVGCSKCNSYFHRICWVKKHQICPKCIRTERRNKERQSDSDNEDNDQSY